MKQIGMMDGAYWSSWLISSILTNTLSTFLLIIMGSIAVRMGLTVNVVI